MSAATMNTVVLKFAEVGKVGLILERLLHIQGDLFLFLKKRTHEKEYFFLWSIQRTRYN